MASVNITHIIGNVASDPEVKYLPNGDAVANFSVATSETWKDKQSQKQERTQWHRMVCYRKLAEIVESYVRKGSSVYIEGRIEYSEYTDKEGIKRYSTQIVANALRMLDKKGESQGAGTAPQNKGAGNTNPSDFDDFEDSIPF
jgi:single-strand DNA-binding protein